MRAADDEGGVSAWQDAVLEHAYGSPAASDLADPPPAIGAADQPPSSKTRGDSIGQSMASAELQLDEAAHPPPVARSATLGFQPAADADDEEAWSGDEEVPLRIDPNSVWGGLSLPGGGQRADCLSLARVRARGVLG